MKKESIEEWIEKMKVRQWLQALSPVLAPAVMFGLWLGFAKLDNRANALSKFIAMTEPIPTIDLSLPKPIVLASLYHSTEDALKMIDTIIKTFEDLPDAIRDLFDEVKEDIIPEKEDIIPDIPELPEELDVVKECVNNAKKNLGWFYGLNLQTLIWIQSCLLQKGYNWSTSKIKSRVKQMGLF